MAKPSRSRTRLSRRDFLLAGTATAAAAKPEEGKLGKQLIGKMEGPDIITDPAKLPKQFKEAPMLAEQVKAGKLPPVEKRLPEEPLVVKPVHENEKRQTQTQAQRSTLDSNGELVPNSSQRIDLIQPTRRYA